ncbi:DUF5665 domain-containing protein [Paenibacillus sp. LHD-117]|uniref:DUF5665 domain-containing protein n=1 Tax=Paenibacillus sp. LHD-117 TaxID=3071412 RepID=UPI0027E052AB|nr:DUF5665 domain-containing protein [Paenibacillus sp. LHD-117]MDQ6418950.1 DUF5665 domain-containing protein [Paenibacillus sp. LHD-117]
MRMKRGDSEWTDISGKEKNDRSGDKETGQDEKDVTVLQRSLEAVDKRLEHIASEMERTHIAEYVDLLNRPMALIWRNLLAGSARGVGIAIGFTFFAATILYVLRILGALNLPIIGDYIADIVKIVQIQLEGKSY